MKKGIIITSPKEFIPNGGISFSGVDKKELRKALTYWDEIAYVTNNLLYQSNTEIEELKKLNKAIELNTPLTGMIVGNKGMSNFIQASEDESINAKIRENPAYWSVLNNSFTDGNDKYLAYGKDISLEIELYQLLPVPSASTPLDHILEFKEKRNESLIEFREYFEGLIIDICNSNTYERKKYLEIEKIKKSLSDIDRLMKENKIKVFYDSLRNIVKKDFLEITGYTATMSGITYGALYTAPQLYAFTPMLAGMATCGISIAHKYITKPKANTQFNYIKSIRKNFRQE
ncbi:DUF6236 family protein [Acinetobacter bereziniae]|uniref:DUF6236 family protein n=1 Tax=Acinetobacter bereziniae TaxID=106648 RepID=UPI000C2B66C9|nr:DUF6236 family protein [Acinetobacter bereziniae]ATZ64230.1 hypothetical protein BSR55_13065 [Acinetobacter bereziniae]